MTNERDEVIGRLEKLRVAWFDDHREPKCPPNPRYPAGIDLDPSGGATRTCSTVLPYPAKRCGYFLVSCDTCGQTIAITTAGRPDDPRSVKIACKIGSVQ